MMKSMHNHNIMPSVPGAVLIRWIRRLQQHWKQVSNNKSTVGYQNYGSAVPIEDRGPDHPVTPRLGISDSKRQRDRRIKVWRRALHRWDPQSKQDDPIGGRGDAESDSDEGDTCECVATADVCHVIFLSFPFLSFHSNNNHGRV